MAQNARYLYMNGEGNVFGPFWLSQMRDLLKGGRIHLRTEVCMEGTKRWEPLEFYPEIYEDEARLPVFAKLRRTKSDPAKLTILMMLLAFVFAIWLIRRV
jgi:GYF domain 2